MADVRAEFAVSGRKRLRASTVINKGEFEMPNKDKQKTVVPSWLKTALRVVFGLGLAGGLVMLTLKSTGANLGGSLAVASRSLLALATLIYGLVILTTAGRWSLLLNSQGIRLSFWTVLRLTMIGFFFNLVAPGAVGGDLVKMAYIARQTPEKGAEAIFSIMVDRIIGLLGLLLIASLAVLVSMKFLMGLGREYWGLQLAAYVVGLGSLAGIFGLLLVEFREALLRHPHIARLVAWGAVKLPHKIVATIERLAAALETYRRDRRTMAWSVALSLLVHTLLSLDLWCIGSALGAGALSLRDYFLTTQVSNAVAGIPLTPAGVGTRDTVTALFFKAMDAAPDKAGAIPVILTLVILFWGVVGAGFFIFAPQSAPGGTARKA
jgi:uncharacterized protein (TIRG00374 family)